MRPGKFFLIGRRVSPLFGFYLAEMLVAELNLLQIFRIAVSGLYQFPGAFGEPLAEIIVFKQKVYPQGEGCGLGVGQDSYLWIKNLRMGGDIGGHNWFTSGKVEIDFQRDIIAFDSGGDQNVG